MARCGGGKEISVVNVGEQEENKVVGREGRFFMGVPSGDVMAIIGRCMACEAGGCDIEEKVFVGGTARRISY